jgi:signal transduction histidine kinase
MPLSLNAKTRAGYLIALLLMLFSYFLVFLTVRELIGGTRMILQSNSLIEKLGGLRTEVLKAETGIRGFALTGDSIYLQTFESSSSTFGRMFAGLRETGYDNARLDSLQTLLDHESSQLAGLVNSYQNGERVLHGRRLDNSELVKLNAFIDQLIKEQQLELGNRQADLRSDFNNTEIIIITSLLIAVVTIVFSITTYNKARKAKEKANEEASSYRVELENKVNELMKANKEIEGLKDLEKFASTGRIARTIAHEVRNPLTNISLATEQIQDAGDPEESAILLDMIRRNANRINQLVSDLLQSTRFAQLTFAEASVSKLIDETLELAKDRVELKKVRIIKEYGSPDCLVTVDVEKMRLALLNIIVNGIEAMEDQGGVLTLRSTIGKGSCGIEISDNGSGMDEETQQKIFEPYFTSKNTGNGLGLTNTQNIILNHGGTIHVKSQPNGGTSFKVLLKAQADSRAKQA